ncbi:hypothetical protein GGF46_002386 [Coemansia sp. RSA 552]|nr:hypothetical protein GGF46_002386 [Coemansia sp. RSA 552]
MARDGLWDSDSDQRHFNPGMYAMRQLGRSVSRRTRQLLPRRNSQPPKARHGGSSDAEENANPVFTQRPPMPSGIHRRSVSFDNLVLLPSSVPRHSTEPSLGSPRSARDGGIPAASTWNSGTTASKATAAAAADMISNDGSLVVANPNTSVRRRWLAGLAHPLSTNIGSEYHVEHLHAQLPPHIQFADGSGREPQRRVRYRERESFSGPAQMDASANFTESQNSVRNTSGPFQSQNVWQAEDTATGQPRPHTSAEMLQRDDNAVPQIVPSTPIASGLFRRPSGRSRERARRDGGTRIRGLARVIGNLSKRLNRIRADRSASQPATPAEVRRSILDSARQNMIQVPSGTGHEFYRFIVNPEDPVSDQDDPPPDSPTISASLVAKPSRHRRNPTFPSQNFAEFKRSVDAEVGGLGAQDPEDQGASSVRSSHSPLPLARRPRSLLGDSLDDRQQESGSSSYADGMVTAPTSLPASASAEGSQSSPTDNQAADKEHVQTAPMTNQGHNGSLSALVQAKLASQFADSVHVSTRLATDLSTESSYGTFIRFHNSGDLSGVSVTMKRSRNSALGSSIGPSDAENVPPAPPPTAEEPAPVNRYLRNQDSIRRFVDEVRAARQETVQRRRESEAQQQVLSNDQAVVDAALYIYERQKRVEAAMAAQRQDIQQGRDMSTQGSASTGVPQHASVAQSTVLPVHCQHYSSGGDRVMRMHPSDGRRRETVFGIFSAPDDSPLPETLRPNGVRPVVHTEKDLPPLPARTSVRSNALSAMKRSQSFSHFGSHTSSQDEGPPGLNRRRTHDDSVVGRRSQSMEERADEPRERPGFLSGIISRLKSSHARRKSSGVAGKEPPRKLTRRPRHQGTAAPAPMPEPELGSVSLAAVGQKLPSSSADVPNQPGPTKSRANATSFTAAGGMLPARQPEYSHMQDARVSTDNGSLTTSGSHDTPISVIDGSDSHSFYPDMGLAGSNVDSSRSIGQVQLAASSEQPPRTGGDGWRDSAVTGLLTQISTATTPKGLPVTDDDMGLEPLPDPDTPFETQDDGFRAYSEEDSEIKADSKEDGGMETGSEKDDGMLHLPDRAVVVDRTSELALDTITARNRGEWQRGRSGRAAIQSMPHSHVASRITSSNGSFADMLASASPEFLRQPRLPNLPGVEGFSRPPSSGGIPPLPGSEDMSLPLPQNDRLRRLEDAVLFGGQRPPSGPQSPSAHGRFSGASAGLCDSPTSDAGTGRTRILDFSETNVTHADNNTAERCRRPSARPEIKDVRGISWSDAEPALERPGAVDANTTGSPTALNSLEMPEAAAKPSAKEPDRIHKQQGAGSPTVHGPKDLAQLVQRSPDPRTLIYDAASQFGSMRSRESPGSEAAEPRVPPRPPLPQAIIATAAGVECNNTATPASKTKHGPQLPTELAHSREMAGIFGESTDPHARLMPHKQGMEIIGATEAQVPADEMSLHGRSHLMAATADSETMAHASAQATVADSPGIAARRPRDGPDAFVPSGNASPGQAGAQRMSFQEYVEQQKLASKSRSSKAGTEQLNFRVSLLERKPVVYNRRARSVSLPAPQPAMTAITGEGAHLPSPTNHTGAVHIPRPATNQRTRSFYDSPLLVQTLLQQQQRSTPSSAEKSPASWPASGRPLSQGADEELEDRARFSNLLGDGAALTSPDLKVARRQSGALPPGQVPSLAFDPERDTGDNGVPDSVLRAYMAGDITAVERFFEHIMLLTTPSSVYDGEVSEDGDWSFGVDGPPPEVLARRAAGIQEQEYASRDLPGMMDASAEASRIAGSGTNVQGTASGESGGITPEKEHPQSRSPMNPAPTTSGVPGLAGLEESRPKPTTAAGAKTPDSSGGNSTTDSRRIAVPRSQLSRSRRSSSKGGIVALSPTTLGAEVAARQLGTGQEHAVHSLLTHSAGSHAAPTLANQPSAASKGRAQAPTRPEDVPCLSPARVREYNHQRQEAGSNRRMPLHSKPPESRKQEKRMLMARLRVLETMIQKRTIEDSRLQPPPPPALQHSRLVDDIQSMESIYSSSMELDYDRIRKELTGSVRQPFEKHGGHLNARSRAIQPPPPLNVSKAAVGHGEQAHVGSNQTEVLKRLRRSSQARAKSPFRASMLERAAVSPDQSAFSPAGPERHWSSRIAEPATSASIPNANQNMSLSDVPEVAYSGRSRGSIRIDIIEERLGPASPIPAAASPPRAIKLSNTGRFRRTAKLLAL